MSGWAFARISLRLTDEEFFRYTPAQLDALTHAWEEERSWEFALVTASALNAKWSNKEALLPFAPKDFLPKSPEEIAKWEAQQAKLRKAQQQFLASGLQALSQSLPKGKPNGFAPDKPLSQG